MRGVVVAGLPSPHRFYPKNVWKAECGGGTFYALTTTVSHVEQADLWEEAKHWAMEKAVSIRRWPSQL